MTGYEAFSLYNSLKLHFSSNSYDYFKYHGKSNISIESFENRKDKYYFYKLSRQQNDEDYIQFLVSNFLIDEKIWVGKLLEEDAITAYKKRMAVIQSLTYSFQNDCKSLREVCNIPNELLVAKDGDYPKLLTMTLQKDTQLETLCILNSLMNFFPMWSKKISDTIRWPEFQRKCLKYTPFIPFDKTKMRSVAMKELM
jgi:hypothetical protein